MRKRKRGTKASDPLVERLAVVCLENPGVREAGAVLGAIEPLLRDADVGVATPAMTADQACARLEQGEPLLRGLDLVIDQDCARDLLRGLARARENALPSESARRLRAALERDDPDVGILLSSAAAGDREEVAAAARRRGLDPDLLWALAQATLRPALRAWRRGFAPLAAGIPWQRSSCFVCGAPAAIGELRADGARHLRCLQCGADWRVRRLRCPSCGNEDHATLCTLYEEGRRGTRRVEACERCRRYVKVIAAAALLPDELLAVEDLATIHLDLVARERGFVR
jgi:FdhE protein